MTGRLDTANFESLSKQAGLDPKGKVSVAGIVFVTDPPSGDTMELLAIVRNGITTTLADAALYADMDHTSVGLVILFKASDSQLIRDKVENLARNVKSAIRRSYGISVIFSFGSITKDPLSLSVSFDQAVLVGNHRISV